MRKPAIKICGMKYNTLEVSGLKPDYLGFIFYSRSPRYFAGPVPDITKDVKRVGVFVNEPIESLVDGQAHHRFDVVQLHGEESPEYCRELRGKLKEVDGPFEIWKAIPMGQRAHWERLKPYEAVIDKFLLDTATPVKGGSGKKFNWDLLNNYSSNKEFVLSGGIGLEQLAAVKTVINSGLPLHAVDLNSRFEIKPGLKDIEQLKAFIDEL